MTTSFEPMYLQSNSENREHLKHVWNVYCVITSHERDLQLQKPQKTEEFEPKDLIVLRYLDIVVLCIFSFTNFLQNKGKIISF